MKKFMLITSTLCLIILTACSTTQADTISPILLVNGGTTEMIVGGTFSPPTVIVSDNVDTDIDVIISGDIVDIHTAGTYTIIYNAHNSAGNAAIEKTFTVNVYDYNEQM